LTRATKSPVADPLNAELALLADGGLIFGIANSLGAYLSLADVATGPQSLLGG
jgi:hypothetical protein